MSCELLTVEDLSFDVKKIIDNIDNVKFDVDLYSAYVEENIILK